MSSDHKLMLCDAQQAVLLIIDVQERLTAAMPNGVKDRILARIGILQTAADVLSIPTIVTEQYPQGLGPTESALRTHFNEDVFLCEKTAFSCAEEPRFMEHLQQLGRQQVVIVGMESHICVLQTALALVAQGYEVYVAEDAVSSRSKANQYNALQRMRHNEVVISNVESVLFEWLADANHASFKTLAKLIA